MDASEQKDKVIKNLVSEVVRLKETRTNEGKRRAVMAEFSKTDSFYRSNVMIAEHCNVSVSYVARCRREWINAGLKDM